MKRELDFGLLDPTEADAVEALLGDKVICGCGANLDSYANKCSVDIDTPCPGFLCVEGARLHLRRRAA